MEPKPQTAKGNITSKVTWHCPHKPIAVFILGPDDNFNQDSKFIQFFAKNLAEKDIMVGTFDFPFQQLDKQDGGSRDLDTP